MNKEIKDITHMLLHMHEKANECHRKFSKLIRICLLVSCYIKNHRLDSHSLTNFFFKFKNYIRFLCYLYYSILLITGYYI